ncbi:MAG: DUF2254 domain-containing protein [Myxococcales bacterium]|nr:MAG: DUF2254 domain-containing protein [Myxococcales bacterium]
MVRKSVHSLGIWLLPFMVLASIGLAVFALTFWVDASQNPDPLRVLLLIFHPNPVSAAATISNAAEVVAAVLAIAITVVAIVVELSSNRYTHRITELFVGEPTNFAVMGLFVVTALQAVWTSLIFDDTPGPDAFIPYTSIVVTMLLLTSCLLILLPYFAYVFAFLNPLSIVERIRKQTMKVITHFRPGHHVSARHQEAVRGIEQLADVALNAMDHKDKRISMASINALKRFFLDYRKHRERLSPAWFLIEGELARNHDFVSMAPHIVKEVSKKGLWMEMKILRQYQTLFNEAVGRMRDINYLIAINTRVIAERAVKSGDDELVQLCIRFFNTYVRATLNKPDVRTAYNVLNQYRLFAERALSEGHDEHLIEIARYFKYYGQISFSRNLSFVLETVAYDLCSLNEQAYNSEHPAREKLLQILLEVDRESETEAQEISLRGVRKAQIKLATYFLVNGKYELAKRIYEDMSAEPAERMASIRDELLRTQSSEYWEISDRGINFDYLSPERRAKLEEFFSWFGQLRPPRPSIALRMIEPPSIKR